LNRNTDSIPTYVTLRLVTRCSHNTDHVPIFEIVLHERRRMFRRIVFPVAAAIALIVGSARANAQGAADQAAVKRAALDYLEGFYEGDTTKLIRSLWPEMRKFGYYQSQPGSAYNGSAMPYAAAIQFARDVRAGKRTTPANPTKEVVVYEVLDQTASVKVKAYWGSDYILLAKQNGQWMITHILWQGPAK
jgi:phage tail sheath protein FI